MELTYYGHSCILLKGARTVLVDPFFPEGMTPPPADIVAVTHGHADHMGAAVTLKRPTVAINEVAKYLKSKGIPAEGMNIGGTITVEGVAFHMVQAVHSSWIEEAGIGCNGGGAAGFVIGMEGKRVYHAGDTALFSDMKLIGELCHPDVALLPIGGRFTMGPEEAMIAAQYIGAPLVIPIHYDTWPVIRQDPGLFRAALQRTTGIRVNILAPGESLTI
ncbi:MAG TPA: metal-dependent hydrolase [Methanoregulaceae archaeon]|jgi:L-ascorbate metabolism protein UlaG (beta-lactamase superfamily)|nr:metal-dependent hydrolase [Methanomicrobiales archaeon]HNJ81870.1 metal-dependent hydrolase [Methanoregulaceae archaeon]HOH81260.1 metal-dependent hydrolase [Methanoregulaceae archaeon]HOU80373.1 metal-dependent hydrolase [Methanoregulaceae archaeon]HPA08975.1 metal-dependent hydrolase [Methanoregulaceae archaeon]